MKRFTLTKGLVAFSAAACLFLISYTPAHAQLRNFNFGRGNAQFNRQNNLNIQIGQMNVFNQRQVFVGQPNPMIIQNPQPLVQQMWLQRQQNARMQMWLQIQRQNAVGQRVQGFMILRQ